MITKTMVANGYKNGYIKVIDSPMHDGAVCQIGNDAVTTAHQRLMNWFYFGGEEAEGISAASYIKNVPEEDIVNEIYETLESFRTAPESADEYLFYEAIIETEAKKAYKS